MGRLAAILIALLAVGCSEEDKTTVHYAYKAVCDASSRGQRADFILACIKNANPKSDEEPEDWIRHCQGIAESTLCPYKQIKVTRFKPSRMQWEISNKEVIEAGQ